MTNNRRLFREEAFARRGKSESLNGLLRVTAPHEWILLVCLGLGVLGFVVWGLFGSVEESVSARCVLALPGDRFAVIAESAGTVVEILADAGDTVAAGQPLARLRSLELSREVAMARSRVEILESRDTTTSNALEMARTELSDLEARESFGEFLITPFGGIVAVYELSIGQAVAVGATVASVRAADRNELEAVAVLLPERAMRLAVGMEARVLAVGRDGGKGAEALKAEVSHIATHAARPPHWLTAFGFSDVSRGYLVGMVLHEGHAVALQDGDPCEARIILRRASPVRMLLASATN